MIQFGNVRLRGFHHIVHRLVQVVMFALILCSNLRLNIKVKNLCDRVNGLEERVWKNVALLVT